MRWIAGFVLVNLCVIAMSVMWLDHSRQKDMSDASTTAQNLSKALEQYILGAVGKIDVALLTVVDTYPQASTRGSVDAQAMNNLLAQQQSHLPELESLRIADAQGNVRYGLGATPGVNVSDRSYFVSARDNPAAGLIISKPVFARISKKWAIVLARRLNRADGSFGGVVYVNVAVEHLGKVFSTLDVGPQGAVTLRDGDLGIITRYPAPQDLASIIGNKAVSAEFREMTQTGNTSGAFTVPAGLDSIERTFAFRRVGTYPPSTSSSDWPPTTYWTNGAPNGHPSLSWYFCLSWRRC
jgi:hypothetical protein